MASLQLEIVTAERALFDGQVDLIVAPGIEGQLAILPNHAPLMTILQAGELRYRVAGDDSYLMVSGGYMEVTRDRVTILADAAERAEEIDEARAMEAVRRAQERIANRAGDIDLERAVRALHRAQVRVQTVTRRRRRREEAQGPLPPSAP